jgi:hypothetical protein
MSKRVEGGEYTVVFDFIATIGDIGRLVANDNDHMGMVSTAEALVKEGRLRMKEGIANTPIRMQWLFASTGCGRLGGH